MTMMRWTDDETYKFVQLYCEHECLWKRSSAYIHNKLVRQSALEDIVRRMGKEHFGVAECKQKINIVRTTYSQAKLKVKAKKGSRSPHIPRIKWFYLMDEMMENVDEGETTTDGWSQNERLQINETIKVEKVEEPIVTSNSADDNEAFRNFVAASSVNDNEAFGKFVAACLNNLPPASAIMAQGKIQKILQDYRLAALNGYCSPDLAYGDSSESPSTLSNS